MMQSERVSSRDLRRRSFGTMGRRSPMIPATPTGPGGRTKSRMGRDYNHASSKKGNGDK
jgi:hypothetical protein